MQCKPVREEMYRLIVEGGDENFERARELLRNLRVEGESEGTTGRRIVSEWGKTMKLVCESDQCINPLFQDEIDQLLQEGGDEGPLQWLRGTSRYSACKALRSTKEWPAENKPTDLARISSRVSILRRDIVEGFPPDPEAAAAAKRDSTAKLNEGHEDPLEIVDEETRTILDKLKEYMQVNYVSPHILLVLLCFVTGRRGKEVKTPGWEVIDEYVMECFIRKRGSPIPVRHRFPTIYPAKLVMEKLVLYQQNARARMHIKNSLKMVGFPVPNFQHSAVRSFYAKIVYRMRHISGFLPDVSPSLHQTEAIGHNKRSDAPYHYERLTVEGGALDEILERVEPLAKRARLEDGGSETEVEEETDKED